MSLKIVSENLLSFRLYSNNILSKHEPLKIMLFSVISSWSVYWIYDLLHRDEPTKKRFLKWFFNWLHKIPQVKRRIKEEVDKTMISVEEAFNVAGDQPLVYYQALPENGFSAEEIDKETDKYIELVSSKWREGYVSGTVYGANDQLEDILSKIFKKFMWTNPLHPDTFLDIRKMEAEIVRMCCTLFNGDEASCGTTTSGGTESIMLAMKAYRDRAYDKGIRYPEIVAPLTAHAAFDKAAQYFRMKIRHVPLDPKSGKVDLKAYKRAINRNTCVLVGSAPEFPHGIVDPIESISKLGEIYKIPVHVDCCLGGFLLPFLKDAGYPLDEEFDFQLPGVTSISCDTHKYAFTPKGSSIIMYRSNEYRHYQFFVQSDWPGGVYASPTFAGSRPGVNIATCWATLMFHGYKGYVNSTKDIIGTARKIKEGIMSMDGVDVFGDPKMSVVSIISDRINIYNLLDGLKSRGWSLNPLQYPSSIHMAVTQIHTKPGVADRFLADLKLEVDSLKQLGSEKNEGSAAIYGMSQSLPDRSLIDEVASAFIAATFSTKGNN